MKILRRRGRRQSLRQIRKISGQRRVAVIQRRPYGVRPELRRNGEVHPFRGAIPHRQLPRDRSGELRVVLAPEIRSHRNLPHRRRQSGNPEGITHARPPDPIPQFHLQRRHSHLPCSDRTGLLRRREFNPDIGNAQDAVDFTIRIPSGRIARRIPAVQPVFQRHPPGPVPGNLLPVCKNFTLRVAPGESDAGNAPPFREIYPDPDHGLRRLLREKIEFRTIPLFGPEQKSPLPRLAAADHHLHGGNSVTNFPTDGEAVQPAKPFLVCGRPVNLLPSPRWHHRGDSQRENQLNFPYPIHCLIPLCNLPSATRRQGVMTRI